MVFANNHKSSVVRHCDEEIPEEIFDLLNLYYSWWDYGN